MDGLEKFKTQIKEELDKLKDENKQKFYKATTDRLVEHIESVCDDEYDGLLAQEHKSFPRLWEYIMTKAKAFEVNGTAFVDDPTVFGWIDEYAGLDDKAEVEKKEKALAKKTTTKETQPTFDAKAELAKLKANTSKQVSIFDMF